MLIKGEMFTNISEEAPEESTERAVEVMRWARHLRLY